METANSWRSIVSVAGSGTVRSLQTIADPEADSSGVTRSRSSPNSFAVVGESCQSTLGSGACPNRSDGRVWNISGLRGRSNLLQEAQALLSALPGYINSLIELSKEIRFIPDLSESLGQLRSFISRIVGVLPSLLQQSVEAILKAVAVLILALYIAYDPNFLIKGILRVTPRRQHSRTKRLLGSINVKLRGWLVGTGVAMLFVGVGATLGLGIIGIPLFLSLGIIAGLLEIVPYFGSIVGTFLPALVAITISPYKLIIVLILFLILNQIDGNIIQPLAMGQQAHLHPALVVIAFLILGTSLGFIGVLLAVPALAVLLALGEEFTSKPPEDHDQSK